MADKIKQTGATLIYVFQTFVARTQENQANITGFGTIDL